jgi:glutamate-ammonia-ligase adenylyltransferase
MISTRENAIQELAQEQQISAENQEILKYVARHSEFIGCWLINNPHTIKDVVENFGKSRSREDILIDIMSQDIFSMTSDEFIEYLRIFKMKEYAHIAADDLCLGKNVEDITAHVSAFASASCHAAYLYADAELKKAHGTPKDEEGEEVGFCVIGLGKLGGWELNFSSDIDIIYVYGTDMGKTDGVSSVENHKYFCKLAEKITHYIGDRTKNGIVFRVDLRLRPDGDRGPLALPLRSYEIFYETHGQSWERMMLLKALPIAGDDSVGNDFKECVKPFVFRRSLDYKLLNELQDIKKKINRRVELKGKNIKHVKLGYGGIREIEFIVQTLQILHYPRNKEVYHRSTLEGIRRLTEHNILSAESAEILSESYRFLRKLEHMVQIENERQTHIVPEGSDTFNLYLERCGFDNVEEFNSKYTRYTRDVNSEFSSLFSESEDTDSLIAIFDEELSDEDAAPILTEFGLSNAEKCIKIIRRAMAGPKSRPRVKNDLIVLKQILGAVIEELVGRRNPEEVLLNFEKLLVSPTSIYIVHDIFSSAPQIITRLINIFSYSSYLTSLIMSNRDLLDYIYDPKEIGFTAEDVSKDLWERTEKYRGDVELEIEASRIRHKDYIFNTGYAYLNRSLNVIDMMNSLTELAKGTVDFAFRTTYAQLVSRYGIPMTRSGAECAYLVVGMGKVGSFEMSFGSDIDMIVLYEDQGVTDGDKMITNQEFFSKLVQRGTSFLNTYTRNGFLYKTDMRLRPSGASGTLVTTIDSFEEYQTKSAMIWEKQALLRSSVINTDSAISEKFDHIKSTHLFTCMLDNSGVQEVYDMRMRIEKEKGMPYERNNIKAGYGGLLDIEFIAQMLQLKFGCQHEDIRTPNTHDALHFFKEAGVITSRDFYSLHKGYLFFRHLENLVRIHENTDTSVLPKNEDLRARLGHFYGYKESDSDALLNEYQNIRRSVRGAFNRIFERIKDENNSNN